MICLQTLSGKELVLGDDEVEDIFLQRGDTLKAVKQHGSTLVGWGSPKLRFFTKFLELP